MGRNKRNAYARMKKIKECDEHNQNQDHSAQRSDDKNACEEGVSEKAITDQQSLEEKSAIDNFYEKLIKLNESSGLSLVFNFREAKMDLHLVFKEVTERGGSYQVSKDGKWNEVASALSVKNHAPILPSQIQKVYENLLCQYEQIHHYRTPAKVSKLTGGDSYDSLLGKRKSCECCSQDYEAGKRKCILDIYQGSSGPGTPEQKTTFQTSLDEETVMRHICAPQKARNSYQLFLKMECQRLRKIHGEASGSRSIRDRAIDAWKHLSEDDRLPYIEASRKDRERFYREMAVYMQYIDKKVLKSENTLKDSASALINFGQSSLINDDYYVTLEADAENFCLPDESLVESTIQMLKTRRPSDPMFQMTWDGFRSPPDTPS
ncbi:putative high mobility group B protein 11 [Coffea arabica]|uniref:High mobility group B protein 11 n=1 Tax=Coffea arabica TaxID=13443 RepID=A0A6P6WHF7_COFAR|nr:putative high mobility group B protein 11 isoform X2 [Coffea arabica]